MARNQGSAQPLGWTRPPFVRCRCGRTWFSRLRTARVVARTWTASWCRAPRSAQRGGPGLAKAKARIPNDGVVPAPVRPAARAGVALAGW